MAAVPDCTTVAPFVPQYRAKSSSNCLMLAPQENQLVAKASFTFSNSSSPMWVRMVILVYHV